MIDTLGPILDEYPGDANRARCFNHVIALVGKCLVCQFDVSKGGADAALDEVEKELRKLADGIDVEEVLAKCRQEPMNGEDNDDDDDDDDDDEMEVELSIEDCAELEASTQPIRLVLVKVRTLEAFGVADLI
jgi:hypothetical protein